jgi:hypothetical protein
MLKYKRLLSVLLTLCVLASSYKYEQKMAEMEGILVSVLQCLPLLKIFFYVAASRILLFHQV